MSFVTINCDMGEGYGLYHLGDDEGLMPLIDVANIACGFHASDPTIMHNSVRLAKTHGVKVGAHPSFPDRQGFGRRVMQIPRNELADLLIYQIGALKTFLEIEGMSLNHIKPHGSLYGLASRDETTADAICDAAEHFSVPIYGMADTVHETVYKERGLELVAEFYADLDYNQQGGLIITREHHAVDPKTAAERVTRVLLEGKVRSVEGVDLDKRADSVCVHSDTPNAVAIAIAVKEAITAFNQSS